MDAFSNILLSAPWASQDSELKLEPMSVETAKSLIANPPAGIKETLETVPEDYSFYRVETDLQSNPESPEEEGVFDLSVNYLDQTRLHVFINDLKLKFSHTTEVSLMKVLRRL